jgi:hypothetical protein
VSTSVEGSAEPSHRQVVAGIQDRERALDEARAKVLAAFAKDQAEQVEAQDRKDEGQTSGAKGGSSKDDEPRQVEHKEAKLPQGTAHSSPGGSTTKIKVEPETPAPEKGKKRKSAEGSAKKNQKDQGSTDKSASPRTGGAPGDVKAIASPQSSLGAATEPPGKNKRRPRHKGKETRRRRQEDSKKNKKNRRHHSRRPKGSRSGGRRKKEPSSSDSDYSSTSYYDDDE